MHMKVVPNGRNISLSLDQNLHVEKEDLITADFVIGTRHLRHPHITYNHHCAFMSKDNPISDNPGLPVFRREEWIDAKRKWGTNLPGHVQDACNQAFSVPSAVIERHIPTDEMPPIELLKGCAGG